MPALNTITSSGEITTAGGGHASPRGYALNTGEVLSVTAGANSPLRVTNIGRKNRDFHGALPGDVEVDVQPGTTEHFGPYPGPRVLMFGHLGAGHGCFYQISREE